MRCFDQIANVMSPEPPENDRELRSLNSEVAALKRDMGDRKQLQGSLLARLREEAALRVATLRAHVGEFASGTLTDDLCMLAARIE
jgi:hypothetical protein